MTTAERQRRFREKINADPQKREDYLMKERERKRLKKSGEILLSIHDLLGSEKRHQRGKGRERKKKHNNEKISGSKF